MLSMELSPLHSAGTITMGGHHMDQLVLPQHVQHMHHSMLQEDPKKKRECKFYNVYKLSVHILIL